MQTRPSRLYLPKFDSAPDTVFEYLLARFPQIGRDVWRDRVRRGLVMSSEGKTLEECSPYRHGMTVFYRREVPSEPALIEDPVVLYQDDEILVADKPHGMPVTPSGDHLDRSLLIRLQKITGLSDLDPIHRLDRDTAGVLLFAIRPHARSHYHRLFAEARVEREYVAAARIRDPINDRRWHIENRIEAGRPWYTQHVVEGPANAVTDIELEKCGAEIGRFRLFPQTGKKHQLRVHMASIGCPVLGDPFYPIISNKTDNDPPLQLLARRLAFTDPLSGAPRNFISTRTLSELP